MKDPNNTSEEKVTAPALYFNRRAFIRAGILAASAVAAGEIYRHLNPVAKGKVNTSMIAGIAKPEATTPGADGFRVSEPQTSLEDITHYNNFQEFSSDKERVLLDLVQPLSGAKFVAFETLMDPTRMPGQRRDVLNWPYVEGLRLDEALHPLTILASGIYGRALPPQDGAPIRLVVPWKYGFKGIKSIVKIKLVAAQPRTTWSEYAPHESGFYANVNPHLDHPRWSQATEQRIGESGQRPTLMFNGYEAQVGQLYAGLDLRKNF